MFQVMQINVDDIIKWGGLIIAILGAGWSFFKFSKDLATKETETKAEISQLKHDLSNQKEKIVEMEIKQKENTTNLSEELKQMSERFENKLEKQDEKHTKAFNHSIAEVKEIIGRTDEKVDKLITLMLQKNGKDA